MYSIQPSKVLKNVQLPHVSKKIKVRNWKRTLKRIKVRICAHISWNMFSFQTYRPKSETRLYSYQASNVKDATLIWKQILKWSWQFMLPMYHFIQHCSAKESSTRAITCSSMTRYYLQIISCYRAANIIGHWTFFYWARLNEILH